MRANISILSSGVALLASVCIAGCAGSMPTPNDQWAAAQADVGRAQAAGAPALPEARLHLQLAQEDLSKSKQLFDHDNRRATSLIAVARAEAILASSLAQESVAESQARDGAQAVDKAQGK
jgi:hypothetical protein